jgi:class 3 adenylate cyclase
MAVPIERGGEVIGSIWLEDLPPGARRPAGVESFARTVAHMEAARAAPPPDRGVPHAEEAARPAREEASDRKEAAFGRDEMRRDYAVPGTAASRRETAVDAGRQDVLWQGRAAADAVEVFPTVTILTVFVPDDSGPAKPAGPGNGGTAVVARADTTAADAVARVLEDVAETQAIPYLKVLGNCVVAAAGFSGEPAPAARAIARAALALRESSDPSARGLRIGIDTGVALGSPVGRGQQCYNLWGAAARRATELARSAPVGGIQVTDVTYRHLSDAFLFRPRGGFYVHPEGETATYLLAGRL